MDFLFIQLSNCISLPVRQSIGQARINLFCISLSTAPASFARFFLYEEEG